MIFFRRITRVLFFLIPVFFLLAGNKDGVPSTKLPIMEKLFGASSGNAVVGNGGLTVCLSKYGEVVSLRWPCSNFYDHLNYRTLYKVPASWKAEDYNPYFNAAENQGAFAGIQYTLDGKKTISWLRNSEWNAIQAYASDDSPIVITRFKNETLGVDVVCTDWVDPTKDILRRMFYVTNRGTKNISELMLVHVANVAPCNETPEFDPGADWADDQKNGFAVAYDSVQEAFIAFRPNLKEQVTGKIPHVNADGKQVQRFVESLDQNFPTTLSSNSSVMQTTDVYCAIGSLSSPVAYSLYEDHGTNPKLPDLITENKKRIGRGPCLVSQSFLLSTKRTTAVTMLFAFGAKASACSNLLQEARQKTAETSMQETGTYWGARMQHAKIPDTKDAGMKKTLQRTLINILLSTNREAGGISSSAGTTQPPYAMIWPRDAAMMGFVLDCAGFHEEAERNSLFFVATQRQNAGEQCYKPQAGDCYKGTWFQCYYANGKPSWMYDFEIDEVGFSIWMFYNHALFLEGEKQKAYLRKVYPSIKLAADFLTTFKDAQTGLQPRAREDDLMWKSQTTLGAGATLVGLKSAIAAAKLLNENSGDIQRWTKRQQELEPAILKYFWKEKTNQFESAVYGNFGPRGVILWPAMYFPASDSRTDGHAQAIYEQIVPFFEKQDQALNKEWWYLGKTTLAMAYAWRNNPEKRKLAENDLRILLNEVCTPDTRVYGETPMVRDVYETRDGKTTTKRVFDNRVGLPCNIAPAYMYMTAEMLYGNATLMENMFPN